MGHWKIEIKYTDADSEKKWDEEDEVDLEWDDLNVAKDNLRRLEEHYRLYEAIKNDHFNAKSVANDLLDEAKTKDWYAGAPQRFNSLEDKIGSLNLVTDDGTIALYPPPYCGYFEYLTSLEIVPNEAEMKVEFR